MGFLWERDNLLRPLLCLLAWFLGWSTASLHCNADKARWENIPGLTAFSMWPWAVYATETAGHREKRAPGTLAMLLSDPSDQIWGWFGQKTAENAAVGVVVSHTLLMTPGLASSVQGSRKAALPIYPEVPLWSSQRPRQEGENAAVVLHQKEHEIIFVINQRTGCIFHSFFSKA